MSRPGYRRISKKDLDREKPKASKTPPLVDVRFLHVDEKKLKTKFDDEDPRTEFCITGLKSEVDKVFVRLKYLIKAKYSGVDEDYDEHVRHGGPRSDYDEGFASIHKSEGDEWIISLALYHNVQLPEAHIDIFCADDKVRGDVLSSIMTVMGKVKIDDVSIYIE